LGLDGLTAAALTLAWPKDGIIRYTFCDWVDSLHSLTVASLITPVGIHLLA
jgi:hypothetical protein